MRDWHEDRERIKADHACACPECDPSLGVMTERQGEQHIGVRFWPDDPEARREHVGAEIILNGERVPNAFEAILGDDGMVWSYRGEPMRPHICLTCWEAMREHGQVDEEGWRIGGGEAHPYGICTMKQAGKVELLVPAANATQVTG